MSMDRDLVVAPVIVLVTALLVSGFCFHRMRMLGIKGYPKWRRISERIVLSFVALAALAAGAGTTNGEELWNANGIRCAESRLPGILARHTQEGFSRKIAEKHKVYQYTMRHMRPHLILLANSVKPYTMD
jgi:hypothetical protein